MQRCGKTESGGEAARRQRDGAVGRRKMGDFGISYN